MPSRGEPDRSDPRESKDIKAILEKEAQEKARRDAELARQKPVPRPITWRDGVVQDTPVTDNG